MPHSKASATRIQAAQRRIDALSLRKAGASYGDIGRTLGCSEQRAHAIVTEELVRLNRTRAEEAAEVTRLELLRLDSIQLGLWQKAAGGDLECIDRLLKLMARRAALLGLDKNALLLGGLSGAPVALRVIEEIIDADEPDRQAGETPPEATGVPAQ